jgi:hypothetical protein
MSAIPIERIENRILLIGGRKVLLDADLAALYGVSTKRFNEQVRRNLKRFPPDFMFRLRAEQWRALRSQFATLEAGPGKHRKYLPLAFTEHGAIMAAAVRAFVRLRELLASNNELARRLDQHEKKLGVHDRAIGGLVSAIRELMAAPEPQRRPIGFVT